MKNLTLQEILFADYMVLIVETEANLQQKLEVYLKETTKINIEISKIMILSTKARKVRINIQE